MSEEVKRILIAGGTGLIGRKLIEFFSGNGHEVAILTRSVDKVKDHKAYAWDTKRRTIDPRAIEWADVIINLSGQGIADKIWTKRRKQELWQSRIDSTRLLVDTLNNFNGKLPEQLINASAIGFYGDSGQEWVDEHSGEGQGFMANLCVAWEKEAKKLRDDIDLGLIRIGVVLFSEGGFLEPFKRLLKIGVAGYFDKGNQYVPWIDIEDLVRIFDFMIQREENRLVVNGVAPQPVSFKAFLSELEQFKKRGFLLIPTPSIFVKPLLGDMLTLFTNSSRVKPRVLEENNFKWKVDSLKVTLAKYF